MKTELDYLGGAAQRAEAPLRRYHRRLKVSSKIDVIKHLLKTADTLLLGGGMTFTFLKAQGIEVGKVDRRERPHRVREEPARRGRRQARAADRLRRHGQARFQGPQRRPDQDRDRAMASPPIGKRATSVPSR